MSPTTKVAELGSAAMWRARHTHEDGPMVREPQVRKGKGGDGVHGQELKAQIVLDVLRGVLLLLLDLSLLGAALATVPKTRGSLSKATLQIHEAREPPKLGICMTITGRGSRLNSLSPLEGETTETQDRTGETNGVGEIF